MRNKEERRLTRTEAKLEIARLQGEISVYDLIISKSKGSLVQAEGYIKTHKEQINEIKKALKNAIIGKPLELFRMG